MWDTDDGAINHHLPFFATTLYDSLICTVVCINHIKDELLYNSFVEMIGIERESTLL